MYWPHIDLNVKFVPMVRHQRKGNGIIKSKAFIPSFEGFFVKVTFFGLTVEVLEMSKSHLSQFFPEEKLREKLCAQKLTRCTFAQKKTVFILFSCKTTKHTEVSSTLAKKRENFFSFIVDGCKNIVTLLTEGYKCQNLYIYRCAQPFKIIGLRFDSSPDIDFFFFISYSAIL